MLTKITKKEKEERTFPKFQRYTFDGKKYFVMNTCSTLRMKFMTNLKFTNLKLNYIVNFLLNF